MAPRPAPDPSAADWLTSAEEPPTAALIAGPPGFEQLTRIGFGPDDEDMFGEDDEFAPVTDVEARVTAQQLWSVLADRTSTPDSYLAAIIDGETYVLSAHDRHDLTTWDDPAPTFLWPADRAWVTTLRHGGTYITVSGSTDTVAPLIHESRLGGVTFPAALRAELIENELRLRPRLTLASQSPARRALLHAAGIVPDVLVSGVDESGVTGAPDEVARTLATMKCRAVADALPAEALVLGCDSVLELDGEALGKPVDAADAVARWRRMRGRSGVLHTGHCLRRGDVELVRGAATVVHFADVTDDEIDAYVATGEPLNVAGAFTIDGRGGAFVTGVEGDPHNVVGLSLPVLREMLAELGVAWTDLWSPVDAPVVAWSAENATTPDA